MMPLAVWAVVMMAAPQVCTAAPDTDRPSAPLTLPAAQLRLALTPHTAMVYEPQRLASPLPWAAGEQRAAPPSLGLEFRSPPSTTGTRAVVRVQLAGDAALQFRPRKGGLAVSYRTQF